MSPHDDLEAFVLGALDPEHVVTFEAHLVACDDCRTGMASYAGVMHALREIPVLAPPAAPRPGATSFRYAWGAGIAAAAILGLLSGQRIAADPAGPDLSAIAAMVAERPRQVAMSGNGVRGAAIVGEAGRRTAFVLQGLPPPVPGRGYQVWVRGARITSPGMLHRTRSGLEILVVAGDVLAGAHHIGITIEPAGGSAARTGPAQAAGDVS